MKYLFIFFAFLVAIGSCGSTYKVISNETTDSTITLGLQYTGNEDYYVKPTSPICKHLKFTFVAHSANDFSFKIVDTLNQRFEVPQEGPFPVDPLGNSKFSIDSANFKFEYQSSPFSFKITRKQINNILFDSNERDIVFSDYYLQITTQVESEYTYGLGERFNQKFRLSDGKWTIFNRDRGQVIDRGQGKQTYGYYPFYLQRENDNKFHISYFRSSNAMDVIRKTANGKVFLTYKVIGGIFDFRFFIGNTSAQATIEKFHEYLGRSAIPPFWSLGFHQCRWGYKNITYMESVLRGYEANQLPLDTIWSDIDYMIDYEDFTINDKLFPLDRMKNILSRYRYIPIIDAGIKVNDGIAYKEGQARGVFIKDAEGNQLRGRVWPGTTTFVDFFHPNATTYWGNMLDLLYEKVQFSGIWLDMNEYANFCDGPCPDEIEDRESQNKNQQQFERSNSTFDYSHDLPYNPGEDVIESHTISLNATHHGGLKEADVHAFGAFLETHATNLFLKSKNLRPFIITRSSTLGSNRYGFHWTGDNYANFNFLRGSIADNFLNQLWGFQMVGPDICGFGGNTTEQICSRWYQLGSLYPFARNHNANNAIDQEPFALGATVLQAAKNNIKLRYSLLKHYYSLFVSKKGLGTIFSPVFTLTPSDWNTYNDEVADTQFLVGDSLMAAPIVQKGQDSRNVYFPFYKWYNFHTGKQYKVGNQSITNVQLTDLVPLFIREGTVVLSQNVDNVTNTQHLTNRFSAVAAFQFDKYESNLTHKVYSARGKQISIEDYNNDQKVDECVSSNCHYLFQFTLSVTLGIRKLHLDVKYEGANNLNQLLILDQVNLYFDDHVIRSPITPIQIKGPISVDIGLNGFEIIHRTAQGHLRPVAE